MMIFPPTLFLRFPSIRRWSGANYMDQYQGLVSALSATKAQQEGSTEAQFGH